LKALNNLVLGILLSLGLSIHLYEGKLSSVALAQDLEESIEAELDNMNAGKPGGGPDASAGAPPASPPATTPESPPPATAAAPNPSPEAPVQTPDAVPDAVPDAAPEPVPEAEPIPEASSTTTDEYQAQPAPKAKAKSKAKKKKLAKRKKFRKAESQVSQGPGIQDEPNLDFEGRIYRIFHESQPVSDEAWSEMLGARREDIYHVQPGDTLWDISKTMFGDGFFWSKLWAENRGLENPHRIDKGQGIGFVAGNEEEEPTIAVVEDNFNATPIKINAMAETSGKQPTYREQLLKDTREEDIMRDNTIEADELIAKPEIPRSKKSRPITILPPSFESPLTKEEDASYDSTGLDAGRVRSLTIPASVVPTSILLDRPAAGVGLIDEIEVGERFAMVGQFVFVRLRRSARIGEKFSVFKETGNIKFSKNQEVGPILEVGGTIKIVAPIDESRNVYRAMVVTSINPVKQGSIVSEDPLPRTNFARRGTLLTAVVSVIGGEFDVNRKVIGESSIVYLDGGAGAGLTAGDLLPVQARRGERKTDSKYPNWSRSIGLLKIVRVEKTVATAIVIEAHEEIHPGDRTGGAMPESHKIYGNELDSGD
jgi:nucleoid-associated protein YgaU